MNDDNMIKKFKEKLQSCDDIEYKLLLLKLYRKYEEYYVKNSKLDYNDISALKIKSAYKDINDNYLIQFDTKHDDSIIKNYLVLLENNINNYKMNDKNRVQRTIDLITILESVLNLDITFPENLEKCLNDEIEKEKKYK